MNHSSKREEIQWEICCCSWEIWETFLVFLFIECYGAAAFCGWIFPIVDVENCNGLLSDGAPEWAVPQHPARGYVTWHKWTTDDHRCNNGRSHRLSFTFQNIQWISIIFEPMKFQERFKTAQISNLIFELEANSNLEICFQHLHLLKYSTRRTIWLETKFRRILSLT